MPLPVLTRVLESPAVCPLWCHANRGRLSAGRCAHASGARGGDCRIAPLLCTSLHRCCDVHCSPAVRGAPLAPQAHEVLGVEPGEVLVHSNVGNQALHRDMNFMATLQYAVRKLQVRGQIDRARGCGCAALGPLAAAIAAEAAMKRGAEASCGCVRSGK